MCASYGLGGGPYLPDQKFDFDPLDERESRALLDEWMREWGAKANTSRTRKDGRTNLNPLVHIDTGRRVLELAWWWHHVGGAPAKYTAFNSRDDNLLTRWKSAFQHRALLPANWYAEDGRIWRLPDGGLFAIAAILSPRDLPDGGTGLAYSMVTREGVGEASTARTARGDSRMPLILPASLHDDWLDPGRPGDADLVRRVQLESDEISRAMTAGQPTLI